MAPKTIDRTERLIKTVQSKLDGNPAILVGSGGSIPYGLPSMLNLAKEIIASLDSAYSTDPGWIQFNTELRKSGDFETALGNSTISEKLHNDIIKVVWTVINKSDREALNEFICTNTQPEITMIIKKFLQRAGSTNIITTNYDRILEYAIDIAKGDVTSGFSGSMYGYFDCPQYSDHVRNVNLYKVHGSVNWFKNNTTSSLFSTNLFSSAYNTNCYPMIVTPGNGKYRETHNDPFRTVMSEADRALRRSSSYLCIGYGFNDEHIQPIIIEENSTNNKPIVIITKGITSKIETLFLRNPNCNCLVISENNPGETLIHYSMTEKETLSGNYWKVSEFYKLWLE